VTDLGFKWLSISLNNLDQIFFKLLSCFFLTVSEIFRGGFRNKNTWRGVFCDDGKSTGFGISVGVWCCLTVLPLCILRRLGSSSAKLEHCANLYLLTFFDGQQQKFIMANLSRKWILCKDLT
jgi:hypothetical protein